MEMRQLRIFCAVAEYGSFTMAAEKVHTVQSNVTMRVKELEKELNQQLFIRQKSGVVLTAAGQTFLGYARRILQLTDESQLALLDTATPKGRLRLGAMETTAAIRLPKILMQYRRMFPQVDLSLMTGTTFELMKAVESHRLDGAFVGGFHQSATLHQEEMLREQLALVSSSEFESLPALMEQIPQQNVLVFRSGCFYRSMLEQWFYRTGLVPNQVMEMGTLDGILTCVAAGMGVTLLPQAIAEKYQAQHPIHCHALPAEYTNVPTVFIRRNDTPVTPALTALMSLTHEHFASADSGSNIGAHTASATNRSPAAAMEASIH